MVHLYGTPLILFIGAPCSYVPLGNVPGDWALGMCSEQQGIPKLERPALGRPLCGLWRIQPSEHVSANKLRSRGSGCAMSDRTSKDEGLDYIIQSSRGAGPTPCLGPNVPTCKWLFHGMGANGIHSGSVCFHLGPNIC